MQKKYIITLSCADKKGIVARVAGFLAENSCNILESAQYNDQSTDKFFMRVVFDAESADLEELKLKFTEIACEFAMAWEMHDTSVKPRVLLLVSKESHCLNHLLHRLRIGTLNAEVPAVVSNHPDLKEFADWHKIPFHHLPVTPETKAEQEAKIYELVQELNIDLVVLARYMQILSPDLCKKLKGQAINIHHSFLPSFKGAKPYNQAFTRGVKIIGATAHYVTTDLDEGPIIEQEVIRVNHTYTAEQLREAGSDIENVVLARAMNYHIERRVLLNGSKTVVFN